VLSVSTHAHLSCRHRTTSQYLMLNYPVLDRRTTAATTPGAAAAGSLRAYRV